MIEDLQNRITEKETESLKFAQELQKKILDSLEKVKLVEAEKQELLQLNQNLRQQLTESEERAKITIQCLTSENQAQHMTISEKDSIIRNIHEQISKLERERGHESMVFVESTQSSVPPNEMMLKSEHDEIVREMNHKLSEELAKNLDFNDMQKVYKDELKCLKANAASTEELRKQMQATIQTLQTSNSENSRRAAQAEREFATARERIDLLNAQVEIYRNDFQMEREAREKIANEKENLTVDLNLLQKRNKELIDETQRSLSGIAPSSSSGAVRKSPSPEAKSKEVEPTYNCPVCNAQAKTLRLMEQHLASCLPE